MVFDCGAVPDNLIESELFGHEKGSFTGAIMTRQGLFEMAHGGTLFLDELGELPLDLQPKLLRALEQREIRRVGSNKPIKVDVRIIAATNRNLEDEVRGGRFRQDLFYRLSVVRVMLPPLRERIDDLPVLDQALSRRGALQPQVGRVAEGDRRVARGDGPSDHLQVAGQRARAGQHHRARGVVRRGRAGRAARPAGDGARRGGGAAARPGRRGRSPPARPTSTRPSRMPRSAGSRRSSATTS